MNSHQELDKEIQKDILNFLNKKPTVYITEVYFHIKNNDLYNHFSYYPKETTPYFHETNLSMVEVNVPQNQIEPEKINLFEKYDNIYDLINKEKNNIEDITVISSKGEEELKPIQILEIFRKNEK